MLVANVRESDICLQADRGAGRRVARRRAAALRAARDRRDHARRSSGSASSTRTTCGCSRSLAGHASVALENARLYESLRREAENAKAWLEFADAVSEAARRGDRRRDRADDRPPDGGRAGLALDSRTPRANYRCVASIGYADDPSRRRAASSGRVAQRGVARRRRQDAVPVEAEEMRRIFATTRGTRPEGGRDRAAPVRLRRPRLDRRARARRTTSTTSPTSGCACSRASPTARRSRCRRPSSSAPSRRAPRSRLRCSSSRAGSPESHADELQPPDRRAGRRDARLAAHVAVARAGPAGVVRDRGRLARRRRRSDRADRQRRRVRRHAPRARARRAVRARAIRGAGRRP